MTSGAPPTAEQVKKIYRSERKLFQPNAKCTLYGTSNNVTSVAYDTGTEPTNGTANTGGGGGGVHGYTSQTTGGNGGSGIVIVRYAV